MNVMSDKGLRQIEYIIKSHKPWFVGKAVLGGIIPAWEKPYASIANVAIMKMINDTR
jgi:hypothetical protein